MRQTIQTTSCDFCGYGGPYSRPEDFSRHGTPGEEIDLCRWCATPAFRPGARTMCGPHDVTIGEKSWTCVCGASFRDTGDIAVQGWPFFVPSRIRRSVPDLTTATAIHHAQSF